MVLLRIQINGFMAKCQNVLKNRIIRGSTLETWDIESEEVLSEFEISKNLLINI